MKNDVIKLIHFDKSGLVPVVVQQYNTGEVLMFAWMNSEAFQKTLKTGCLHYFSRSRGQLWRKGEKSGQEQHLIEFRLDCDGDALLALVDQAGVACHTGRRTCFYTQLSKTCVKEVRQIIKSQEQLYG
jgi:phosphoribosyl-AMP cyclohydrolase